MRFLLANLAVLADSWAMRHLLPLLIVLFAAPVFGQGVKPADGKAANFTTENWSKLGRATEGPRGFTLYGRDIRLSSAGQYELWVKVVPANTAIFNRRYDLPKSTAFVLQYTIVDCAKRLLSFEKTSLYNSANGVIEGRVTGLVSISQKNSVRPGSIGESVYKNVCVDPTTLPKNEQ
mgnify:CR=1 FL=1